MSGASVFDLNILTPTVPPSGVIDSKVQTVVTPNTKGAIETESFLQFAISADNNLQQQNTLLPGNEQHLVLSGPESVTTVGNLTTYVAGSVQPGVSQPLALQFAVGKDWQYLIQGVNLSTKANQTGVKMVFWDQQMSTNADLVKVSYFLPTSTQDNNTGQEMTFGQKTLIQMGDRNLLRNSTETKITVGNTSMTVQGTETTTVHGKTNDSSYAGRSSTVTAGGTDVAIILGLKSIYIEAFYGVYNPLANTMIFHLYFGGLQLIGTAASLLNNGVAQTLLRARVAQLTTLIGRAGTGVINFFACGNCLGTPRI